MSLRKRITTSPYQTYIVERLPNGFVRVDTPSGLVHVWECVNGHLRIRSGNGASYGYPVGIQEAIEAFL